MTEAAEVVRLDPDEWAQLVRASSLGTIFHGNEWLAVLEEAYGCRISRLGVAERGRLVGGIPVAEQRKLVYRLAGSPPTGMVTPYQGPICGEMGDFPRVLGCFWQHALSRGWDYVEVASPPGAPAATWGGQGEGRSVEQRETIVIDLRRGEGDLFGAMEPECRRNIRQAERRGATLAEFDGSGTGWIEQYYEMSAQTYRRQRRPPAIPKRFFHSLRTRLGGVGKLKVSLVLYQGTAVAGGLFLVDRDTIYFCDGASLREFGHVRANNLLHWEVIRWGAREGFRAYDMVGANIASIARFKRGFGGQEMEYPTWKWANGWAARLGERGYRALTRVMRPIMAKF